MPKVSVIVPVYNSPKKYLDACLKSILSQTFSDIEIILVDDGSASVCGQVCDDYARADSRVRVIHQENQGVSAARNNGIKAAQADWIMFVDADDWLEHDTCEKLKVALEQGDCDILMFNGVKEFANKTSIIHADMIDGQAYDMSDVSTREFLYRKAMRPQRGDVFYYSWDKIYKRKFLLENNILYPLGIPKSEDKVFILSCLESIKTFRCTNSNFYHYRINAASVCHRYSENADCDRIKLSHLLGEIAKRMDKELGYLTGKENYAKITKDYYRFLFGIISDVLFLKYYHPDNPQNKRERKAEAKEFIRTDPFKTAIRECKFCELSKAGKLKKLLLQGGFVSLFFHIRSIYDSILGNVAQE